MGCAGEAARVFDLADRESLAPVMLPCAAALLGRLKSVAPLSLAGH